MIRTERLQTFQLISWLLAFACIGISIWQAIGTNQIIVVPPSLFALFFLVAYSVLHFMKIEMEEDLKKSKQYFRVGILFSLTLQLVIVILIINSKSSLLIQYIPLGTPTFRWIMPILISLLLAAINLYFPAQYRMESLRQRGILKQTQALRELRADIRLRTEQLFAFGILPELKKVSRGGREIPVESFEDGLRIAIQKIGGIENVLQYMVLDKYLELLENRHDMLETKSVLIKWSLAAWGGIVFLYQILISILNLLGAIKDLSA